MGVRFSEVRVAARRFPGTAGFRRCADKGRCLATNPAGGKKELLGGGLLLQCRRSLVAPVSLRVLGRWEPGCGSSSSSLLCGPCAIGCPGAAEATDT